MEQTKLSKLQRWILIASYEKIEHLEPIPWEMWRKVWATHLLPREEIVIDYFKLPTYGKVTYFGYGQEPKIIAHIDLKAAGPASHSANASMSRALHRLMRRGLLIASVNLS
jgi:hypothetical protein